MKQNRDSANRHHIEIESQFASDMPVIVKNDDASAIIEMATMRLSLNRCDGVSFESMCILLF